MKTIDIRHRDDNSVLFTTEVDDNDTHPVRTALMAAIRAGRDRAELVSERDEVVAELGDGDLTEDAMNLRKALVAVIDREIGAPKARAYLADANLADANLAGANLARANLADAYLAGANLAGAYLADANLAGANLARANLADANLAGANLARANLADAYLAGANLADANLADANLAGAYLADANLAGANLARANLADAYLAGANLARANLADAYLAGANLAGANLADANLADAYLAGANLADANLADAYLADAYLADANLARANHVPPEIAERAARAETDEERLARQRENARRYREARPEVPVIPDLDSKILRLVDGGEGKLEMNDWHTCQTTHCRAGWAVHLAGDAGYALEGKYGPEHAGAMIYRASTGRVPYFFGSNDDALEDIKRCAAEQSEEHGASADQ
jgi:uncharacterized protein YjbI with pentapeptide repeats